ncbi:MAG: ABC transporter ATP-binding protein [Blastocatellia bacterium]|nr:ABC transporter ATP-binding protein [Blastocatellia bacterium]
MAFRETQPAIEPHAGKREALRVLGLSKWFGSERVLDDVSFSIAEGESLVLLGHSGSGKSTTLRIIAGLIEPDAGEVYLRGKHIEHLRARDRNMGVIFQNYALFPRMTVEENIGFGLRIRGMNKEKRKVIVDELLGMTGMSEQRDKYPSQISGGQQQRVAIARALAYKPDLLLFDESFSALDPHTRVSLRREIRALLRRLKVPALFITHDQEEAMELGDEIAILNHGRLEQIGPPDEVYNNPQTEFVATFLGTANVVQGSWRDGLIALDCDRLLSPPGPMLPVFSEKVKIVFRPEDITLGPPTGLVETPYHLGRAEVIDVTFTGAAENVMVRLLPKEENAGAVSGMTSGVKCDFVIKVLRTKWDSLKLKLSPGEQVSVGLKSYKILRG